MANRFFEVVEVRSDRRVLIDSHDVRFIQETPNGTKVVLSDGRAFDASTEYETAVGQFNIALRYP